MVRLSAGSGTGRRGDSATVNQALRLDITGVVQGVGFRPFVHRLALRHGLSGWVRNTSGEVQVEIEGSESAIDEFLEALEKEAPPLARIEQVQARPSRPNGLGDFSILESA